MRVSNHLNNRLNQLKMSGQFTTLGQLKDLLNTSTCPEWQKEIKEVYLDCFAYSKDTLRIEIQQSSLDLLRKKGTEKQKEAVTKLGIKFAETFNVGDWVTVKEESARDLGYASIGNNNQKLYKKGYTFKVGYTDVSGISEYKDCSWIREGDSSSSDAIMSFLLRKATEEEIKQATCIKRGTVCILTFEKEKLIKVADGNGQFYLYGSSSGSTSTFRAYTVNPTPVVLDI